MSYSEFTKELLDILDLNLTFHEDAFRKERINDETCFVFDGTLTYQPEECFHCHYQNKQTIIKWGWKKVSILLIDVSNYKTIVRINKQRFKCKHLSLIHISEPTRPY